MVVVLSSPIFVRNYVESGALADLADASTLRILATDELRDLDARLRAHPGFAGYVPCGTTLASRHLFLFDVLMWRNRKRSGGFRFRALRMLGLGHVHRMRRGPLRLRVRAVAGFVRYHLTHPTRATLLVLGLPGVAEVFTRFADRVLLPVDAELERRILDQAPDVIVFPSSAYDPIGNDLSRIGRRFGVSTLFLVDNWDNLSSKSILWAPPDHLGVWGPQSAVHARTMQGLPADRVNEVGTPRFDAYFQVRDVGAESPFPFPYALFVGCASGFDETTALRLLDAEIADHPESYGELRLVYRPHPWRQEREREEPFNEATFRRVVLDPQIAAVRGEGGTPLPALEYYGPLLHNARLVVAPLTTMLIESLLFRKPTLVIAYDDGIHISSPHNAYRHFEHFRGIEAVDLIRLCQESCGLADNFRAMIEDPPVVDPAVTDEQASWFLRAGPPPYAVRLREVVAEVWAGRDRASLT